MIYRKRDILKPDHFSFQPGDATNYEFVIFEDKERDYFCAGSLNRLVWVGEHEVVSLVEAHGNPPDDREEYREWANAAGEHFAVAMVRGRDQNMNPWTALAILAAIALRRLNG